MSQNNLIGEFEIPLKFAVMFNDGVKMNLNIISKVLLENFDLFKEKTNHDPMNLSPEIVAAHYSRKPEIIYKLRTIILEYNSDESKLLDSIQTRISDALTQILASNGIKLIRIDKFNILPSDHQIINPNTPSPVRIVKKTGKGAIATLALLLFLLAAVFFLYYLQSTSTIRLNNLTIAENTATISLLESDISSLNSKIGNLSADIDSLQQNNTALNTQLVSVQNELTSLNKEYSTLEDDNQSLSREVNELELELDEIDDELELYKDTYGSVVTSGIQPPFGRYVNRLINNDSAENPTYQELINFLEDDETDQNLYIVNKYMCGHFASDLHNNAEDAGYKSAFVAISFDDQADMHACNAFLTTDQGLVFIDSTGRQRTEIEIYSYDKIVDLEIGKQYIPEIIFPDSDWDVEFDSMGLVDDILLYW